MSAPRGHIPGHMVTPQTQTEGLEAENAHLRARLDYAEGEVRRLLRTVEDARRALAQRLAHAEQEDTPICTRCHRPLVVPQVLDHIETDIGWVCIPCVERPSDAVAWAPLQGGDLPQTP